MKMVYLKEYYDYLRKFTDNYRINMGISYFKLGGIIDGNIKIFGGKIMIYMNS